ncbi:MAG: cytochrome C, partial [Lentisphaeraceae bacterium]|nr:cytochrome C [Lentisphaeraceae bacterium]
MNNKRTFSGLVLLLAYSLATGLAWAQIINQAPDGTLKPWSPEKTIKNIEVPKGYKLQLVASEPMVQEPVCFTFDPDGAMYVCEWNTYMQDQYGSGQNEPKSRIIKLVDTDGDGKMDKRTVFAKGLLLPRAILALHDRILIRFTFNSTIWSYFDDNGDGVSDRREVAFKGRRVGGNIEHQDNTLIWNVD